MPELPEVQTVVNGLANKIIGKVFFNTRVLVPRMVSTNLKKSLINKKVLGVVRRAKMIVMELNHNYYLVIHLKMTGQLIYIDQHGKAVGGGHPINYEVTKPNKFTRIILYFKNSSFLLYNDVRKFGWLKLLKREEYLKLSAKHGLEPLSKEFTLNKFKEILESRPKSKIKQLLLDQGKIVGLGNIYVDECLFKAKIKPMRAVLSLKGKELSRLYLAIKLTLNEAIKCGGTSVSTFINSSGEKGKYVEKLKVYGRGNLSCYSCKNKLKKIKIAGRGTVYCSKCQK